MASQNPSRRGKKEPPLGETGQETLYLRFLSEKQVRVNVKLRDGENVSGWIEYFDDTMIRLTREGQNDVARHRNNRAHHHHFAGTVPRKNLGEPRRA